MRRDGSACVRDWIRLGFDVVKAVLAGLLAWILFFHFTVPLGDLDKKVKEVEQLRGELENNQKQKPILALHSKLQFIPVEEKQAHVEVVSRIENIGFADVEVGAVEITVARGVPDGTLRGILDEINGPPSSRSTEIANAVYGLTRSAEVLDLMQRKNDPAFALALAQKDVADEALLLSKLLKQPSQTVTAKPIVPESEVFIVDLNRSPSTNALGTIVWSPLAALHRREVLNCTLHEGHDREIRFRYLIVPHPPECYRFTVVAHPKEPSQFEKQEADVILPLDYVARQFATGRAAPEVTYGARPPVIELDTGSRVGTPATP